tara:strand:- start:668 stop:1099 length:432 start_codon:yes stop_codon:yes gene_type:complete
MSKIKKMMAEKSSVWIEYPDVAEFSVNLNYLTREDLMKIRNASLTYKFNKRTRQREEEVDNDRFLENYAEKAIIGWKGLKVKHMPALMPVDISGMDIEEDVDYSNEDAIELLKNSTVFDQFITDAMNDFEQFSKKKAETDSKN